MKKFDVYAIGNALLDMEYQIDESILSELSIEKGKMTLVDESFQQKILDRLKNSKPFTACGGSAANTLIAISQFGGNAFYSCKVAGDEAGNTYEADLKRNGLKSNIFESKSNGTTGKCIVMITKDAERTMNTFLGVSETLSDAELRSDNLISSEYLYLEGYLITSQSARTALKKAYETAKKNGVKIAVTFSDPNIVKFFKNNIHEIIKDGVDTIFCNKEEAINWTNQNDPVKAARALSSLAKEVIITLGSDGSLVFKRNGDFLELPAIPIQAVNTNGAGDMYAGAFLFARTHGATLKEAATFANAASAKVVSIPGPRLTLESAKKIKETHLKVSGE